MAEVSKASRKPSTPAQPKMIDQIVEAIKKRAEAKGSSVSFIKKTLEDMGVDTAKKNTIINTALKRGVTSGVLKQVKGTGATGTFKIDTARSVAAEKEQAKKQKEKERKAKKAESDKNKKVAAKEKAKAKKEKTKKVTKKAVATKKKVTKPKKKVTKTPTKKAAAKKTTKTVKPKMAVKPKKPAPKKAAKKTAKK